MNSGRTRLFFLADVIPSCFCYFYSAPHRILEGSEGPRGRLPAGGRGAMLLPEWVGEVLWQGRCRTSEQRCSWGVPSGLAAGAEESGLRTAGVRVAWLC